jgi:hypothetical protein
MYSGTTLRRDSGRLVGAHQKIDRVARRHLEKHVKNRTNFPTISAILHFEGKNGPDGIKLKSPMQDEFEHVIDPSDPNDTMLLTIIDDHIFNLSDALRHNNYERASFESAWLAHAIVDGLTPPHHFNLDDEARMNWISNNAKITKLKDGYIARDAKKRSGFIEKWGSWGSGGVVAHIMFELGVASVITPGSFKQCTLIDEDIDQLKSDGFEKMYNGIIHEVYEMDMYNIFCKKGWTRDLARKAKAILVPEMIRSVQLAWYQAVILSEQK